MLEELVAGPVSTAGLPGSSILERYRQVNRYLSGPVRVLEETIWPVFHVDKRWPGLRLQ